MTESKKKIDLPFKIVKSEVSGGYIDKVHTAYTGGIDVTNYHEDKYGHFENVPLQSPFTETHVGGKQHRHVEIGSTERPEAFHVEFVPTGVRFYSHKQKNSPPAYWTRDGLAKRAVNLKNIQTTTSSLYVGNYSSNYEVVQTSGRRITNNLIVDGFEASGVLTTQFIHGEGQYSLPELNSVTGSKSIFVERFSAPGGKEESSRGSLDREGEEYSPNSPLPFRNIKMRKPFYGQLSQATPQGGSSIHGVNRNRLVRAGNELVDNGYVSRPIPSTDIQYSWVTASSITTAAELGGYQPYGGNSAGDVFTDIAFISGSLVKSGSNTQYFVDNLYINSLAKDSKKIDLQTNTFSMSGSLSSSLSEHVNSPYTYTTWTSLRNSEGPVSKALRANNIISVQAEPKERIVQSRISGKRIFLKPKRAIESVNYVDPPVTFKYKPLKHRFVFVGTTNPDVGQEMVHTYVNNLSTFANKELIKRLSLKEDKQQFYNLIYDYYTQGDQIENNPIERFLGYNYTETVWPREKNTGLAKTRKRAAYYLDRAGFDRDGYDRQLGTQRVFWRDNQEDRKRSKLSEGGYYSSIGYLSTEESGSSGSFLQEEAKITSDNRLTILSSSYVQSVAIDSGFFNSIIMLEELSQERELFKLTGSAESLYEIGGNNANEILNNVVKRGYVFDASGEFNNIFIDSFGQEKTAGIDYKINLGALYRNTGYKSLLTSLTEAREASDQLISQTEDEEIFQNPKLRYLSFIGGGELNTGSFIQNSENFTDRYLDFSSDFNGPVNAIVEDELYIYFGGQFTAARDTVAFNVIRYRKPDQIFEQMNGGLAGVRGSEVKDLFIDPDNGDVYAAGLFGLVNYDGGSGDPAYNIAKWNGITWEAFNGTDGIVNKILKVEDTPNLFIFAGKFSYGDWNGLTGVPAKNIYVNYSVENAFFDNNAVIAINVKNKLTASDKEGDDYFGYSVSMNAAGDRVIVGAYGEDPSGIFNAGSAYVFISSSTGWIEESILTASDKGPNDSFGYSVSMNAAGDRVIIGARWEDPGDISQAGSAYVFISSSTGWIQEPKLTASDKEGDDFFGNSVSMNAAGDRVIVGAFGKDPGSINQAGSAYVFVSSSTGWIQEPILTASNKALADYFGISVSMNAAGDRVIIGAYLGDQGSINQAGSAYVFVSSSTGWIQEPILAASDKETNDGFGYSVSMNALGDRVIVGAYGEDPSGIFNAGSAYVFISSSTGWIQELKLTASDKGPNDYFGNSVSMNAAGDRVIVGAYGEDPGRSNDESSAHVFVSSSTGWIETKLISNDKKSGALFGHSVSMNALGDRAIVGAYGDRVLGIDDPVGSAYVFDEFDQNNQPDVYGTDDEILELYYDGNNDYFAGGKFTKIENLNDLTYSDAIKLFSFKMFIGGLNSVNGNPSFNFINNDVRTISKKERILYLGGNFSTIRQDEELVDANNLAKLQLTLENKISQAEFFLERAETKLTVSDKEEYDQFGYSVSMNAAGDRVIVGVYNKRIDGIGRPGAAYVFENSSTGWIETRLIASDKQNLDYFGNSVSMNAAGDRVIVGAYGEDPSDIFNAGSAYVFISSSTGWIEESILTASDKEDSDYFGYSVSMNAAGDRVIVGAHQEDPSGIEYSFEGSAYVFISSSTGWIQEPKLTASNKQSYDFFGYSVSMNALGDRVIVGAYLGEPSGGLVNDEGSAYVFVSSSTGWIETKLTASNKQYGAKFGNSVSMNVDGDRVIVGAYRSNVNPYADAGSAYVFISSSTGWIEESILTASDKFYSYEFGISVSMNALGDRVIVGSHQEDSDGILSAGSAYITQFLSSTFLIEPLLTTGDLQLSTDGPVNKLLFSGSDLYAVGEFDNLAIGTGVKFETKLTASDKGPNDYFGNSVSMNALGDRVIVGAYLEDPDGIIDAGSAYVFINSSTGWIAEQKLTASDKGPNDYFGNSVSMNDLGDRVIVGAYLEDPSGISNAGSAYVFISSSTGWIQEPILTASDKQTGDYFGYSVSMNALGDRVIVGAYREDPGPGLGVTNAGSVYIFASSSTGWRQETKLTASVKEIGAVFGYSVSMNALGDRVIVGAYLEDSGEIPFRNEGSAYVFVSSSTGWIEEPKLTASDKGTSDSFGRSVSMNDLGDRVIIGAYLEDPAGTDGAGSAYVFVSSSTGWIEEPKLTASDKGIGDRFGYSVSMNADGDRVIVGSRLEDPDGIIDAGSAYVFISSSTGWIEEQKLTARDKQSYDFFGHSVLMNADGDRVIVGSWSEDPGDIGQAGSAYVFDLRPQNIFYEAKNIIKITNNNDYDSFEIGGGVNNTIRTTLLSGNKLYIGGDFTQVSSSLLTSSYISQINLTTEEYSSFISNTNASSYNLFSTDYFNQTFSGSDFIFSTLDNGLFRTTELDSGKKAFFESYEQFIEDVRGQTKDHSLIPEFRISEHVDYYVKQNGGNFRAKNKSFLSIDGVGNNYRSSTIQAGNYDGTFIKSYATSDLMKKEEQIKSENSSISDLDSVTIKISGIKKLLPYNGFYPQQRTVQLANLYSDYADNVLHGGVYNLSYVSDYAATSSSPATEATKIHSIAIERYGDKYHVITNTLDAIDAEVKVVHKFGDDIYVGGSFTKIANIEANYIAKFDTIRGVWESLGAGPTNTVNAITDFNDEIYVGGDFNDVYRYNGVWTSVSIGDTTNAFAVSGSTFYAGGEYGIKYLSGSYSASAIWISDFDQASVNCFELIESSLSSSLNGLFVGLNNSFLAGQTRLTASDKQTNDEFGVSVSMNALGDRVIVGAKQKNPDDIGNAGAAYVFVDSSTGWIEEPILTASVKQLNAEFGNSVSMNDLGDRVIVGAYLEDPDGIIDAGSAYVFISSSTGWIAEQKLTASDKEPDNYFGTSVSMNADGDRVIVGAWGKSIDGFDFAGSVYIFASSSTGWNQETRLTASDKQTEDYFGASVSMNADGDRVIVSAEGRDPDGIIDAGSVYIFASSSTGWSQETILTASDKEEDDTFGTSVSMNAAGDHVIVGAYREDPGGDPNDNEGSAYVFVSSSTGWIQTKLTASNKAPQDYLGLTVSMNDLGDRVIAGCRLQDPGGILDAGSAYVFISSSTGWIETILTASYKVTSDNFGSSVSMNADGNLVIVGSWLEDPAGIINAGSAYVIDINPAKILRKVENFYQKTTSYISPVYSLKYYYGRETDDNFGEFLFIGGQEGLTRWNISDYPLTNNQVVGPVRAIEIFGDDVYFGGDFTYIGSSDGITGLSSPFIGYLEINRSANTYQSTAFTNSPNNTVNVVKNIGSELLVGGNFTEISNYTGESNYLLNYSVNGQAYYKINNNVSYYTSSLNDPFTLNKINNISITNLLVGKRSKLIEAYNGLNLFSTRTDKGQLVNSLSVNGTSWRNKGTVASGIDTSSQFASYFDVLLEGEEQSQKAVIVIGSPISNNVGRVYVVTGTLEYNYFIEEYDWQWSEKKTIYTGTATGNLAGIGVSIISCSSGLQAFWSEVYGDNPITDIGNIYVCTSNDGGTTWTTPIYIATGNSQNSKIGFNNIRAVNFKDKSYVFFNEPNDVFGSVSVINSSDNNDWGTTNISSKKTLLYYGQNDDNALNITGSISTYGIEVFVGEDERLHYAFSNPFDTNSNYSELVKGSTADGIEWKIKSSDPAKDSILKLRRDFGSNTIGVSYYYTSDNKKLPVFFSDYSDDGDTYGIYSFKNNIFTDYTLKVNNAEKYYKHVALEPFMAPGILYNTIKSGIAVDWPCATGSNTSIVPYGENSIVNAYYPKSFEMYSYEGPIVKETMYGQLRSNIDYRIPFENILFPNEAFTAKDFLSNDLVSQTATRILEEQDPVSLFIQGTYIYGGYEPYINSFDFSDFADLGPKRFSIPFVYRKNNAKDTGLYSLGMSNFLAETVKFFLKDEKMTTFTSEPDYKWSQFSNNVTYYMDLVLEKSPELVMMEAYHGDKHPIGPSGEKMNGRYFGYPVNKTDKTAWGGAEFTEEEARLIHNDPAYAPYTPPYFEGEARARLSFTPNNSRQYTLQEIFDELQIENIFLDVAKGATTGSDAYLNKMPIGSSIEILGSAQSVEVTIDEISGEKTVREMPDSQTWILSPRMETPVLNFVSQSIVAYQNDYSKTSGFGRGMWSGYGKIPNDGAGVKIRLEYPFPNIQSETTASLIEQVGFKAEERNVGQLAETKLIKEAIVLIPYLETVSSENKKIIVKNSTGFNFIKIDKKKFKQQKQNIEEGLPAVPKDTEKGIKRDILRTSISEMITKIKDYVIPPEMNFLEYSDIAPFVMYIFEFEHTLDQQDLADIWQSLMPKISYTAEEQEVSITHKNSEHELFEGKGLPDNLRWLVFKVKKKAEYNYFNVTATTKDDSRFDFNKIIGRKEGTDVYSYNWPYDYFSLVEFAKVELSLDYIAKAEEETEE